MARIAFLKKVFLTGACLYALVPTTGSADIITKPAPIVELPPNTTVTSITSAIVEHGDLRDAEFISNLFGRSLPKGNNNFLYAIKSIKGLYFQYSTTLPDKSLNYRIVSAAFEHLPSTHCIAYSDFKTLFSDSPKESKIKPLGITSYVFQKDISPEFYLTLGVDVKGACALNIGVNMYKKVEVQSK